MHAPHQVQTIFHQASPNEQFAGTLRNMRVKARRPADVTSMDDEMVKPSQMRQVKTARKGSIQCDNRAYARLEGAVEERELADIGFSHVLRHRSRPRSRSDDEFPASLRTRAYFANAPDGWTFAACVITASTRASRVGVIAPVRVDHSVKHIAAQDVDFFAHCVVAIKAREGVSIKEPFALHANMLPMRRMVLCVRVVCKSAPLALPIGIKELPDISNSKSAEFLGFANRQKSDSGLGCRFCPPFCPA